MFDDPKFTIFTPSYNRAHTLARVHESLTLQTYRKFEWVVVDDGSTDGTKELVLRWVAQSDFPIRYFYQENSGKHIAFNRAVEFSRGELFLPVDSDDAFVPNALERLLHWWKSIPEGKRNNYTGIVCLCQDEQGHLVGQRFPENPLDTNALDLTYKLKIRGEKWGFHRTEVLRDHPFPEDAFTRFIPERVVWDQIARKFQVRCVNEPLRIYYQDSGNQLTKTNLRSKASVRNYFLLILNRDLDCFRYDPKTFIKLAVLYARYSFYSRDRCFLHPKKFTNIWAYFLCGILTVPGFAVFVYDLLKEKINYFNKN